MSGLIWTPLAAASFTLAAGPFGSPWVVVLDDLGSSTHLRLDATGSWTALAGVPECGPDGLAGTSWPDDRLLLTDCPVGALIGRIGGSSASLKSPMPDAAAGESKPFAVGRRAVVKLPDKAVGPLFVGFNVVLRPIQVTSLEVAVSGIRM